MLKTHNPAMAAANDNARAFNALCAVIHIVKGKAPELADDSGPSIDLDLEVIKQLNLSTAEDELYDSKFEQEADDNKKPKEYQENRESWKRIKALIDAGKTEIDGIKLQRPRKSHARRAAAAIINRTLKQAEAAKLQLKTGVNPTEVQQHLDRALFGKTGKETTNNDETYGQSGAKACGDNNPTSNSPGISLLSDLVCLCSDSGGNSPDCTGQALTSATYTNPATAQPVAAALLKACPKQGTMYATPSTLTAAKSILLATLKEKGSATQADNVILGSANREQCNGGAQGLCVRYKPLTNTHQLDIPWLSELEAAQTKIETLKENQATNRALAQHVKALRHQALMAYLQAMQGDTPQTASSSQPTIGIQEEPANSECNARNTRDKCKEPCKWNNNATEKTKKCSLDPKKAAEKAAQAVKDGGDKKENKCVGKEEKECEKATGFEWEGKE
uniref:Variant surface glycoprotein 1125.2553 n=1 Tax=Trypanosoma brucei TaxID=5691 RepID=A0A1J0R812_9TRYP|nr:variant surface glycoprotein 1125.2553 [Trypanosoma brucei]